MLEQLQGQELEYKKLTPEEMQRRGILGRLIGVCASFVDPTRNGRRYSEELWEKTFKDPIMVERIQNGVCYGELGHPENREETDMEKIAVCLSEVPKKGKDGKLRAVFDILNTPNGKILKALCDYGSTLGVSSRGSGETFTDYDGQESVDPDSYSCQGFDIVLIPAVKAARLSYVNESLEKNSLKESLRTTINKASQEERKVMKETLNNLHIKLNEQDELPDAQIDGGIDVESSEYGPQEDFSSEIDNIIQFLTGLKEQSLSDEEETDVEAYLNVFQENIEKYLNKDINDINDDSLNIDSDIAVDNDQAITESLRKLFQDNKSLENQIISLQEKLSVAYDKEASMKEEISKYKNAIARLASQTQKYNIISEKLNTLQKESKQKNFELKNYQTAVSQLTEKLANEKSSASKLTEERFSDGKIINTLREEMKASKLEKDALQEDISSLKKDLELKKTEILNKEKKYKNLVEQYKNIASGAVDRYIECQAKMLGITPKEIKSKLPESYNFKDIDNTCNDLRQYKLNMSRLPFSPAGNKLNEGTTFNAKITSPNKEPILEGLSNVQNNRFDDEIDSSLQSLAGL